MKATERLPTLSCIMCRYNALIVLIWLTAGICQPAPPESAPSSGLTATSKPAQPSRPAESLAIEGDAANRSQLPNSEADPEAALTKQPPDPTAGKIVRYAENLIRKHDANGNGVLDEQEWRGVGGNPLEADLNQDGTITPAELIHRIVVYGRHRSLRLVHPGAQSSGGLVGREANGTGAPGTTNPADPAALPNQGDPLAGPDAGDATTEAGAETNAEKAREQSRRARKFFIPREKLPAGIASWFIDRDADGDGQITMREFSGNWSTDIAAQFSSYDRNRDGVITAAESVTGGIKANPAEPTDAAAASDAAPRAN